MQDGSLKILRLTFLARHVALDARCDSLFHVCSMYRLLQPNQQGAQAARANIHASYAQLVVSCRATTRCFWKLWRRQNPSCLMQEEGLFAKGTSHLFSSLHVHSPIHSGSPNPCLLGAGKDASSTWRPTLQFLADKSSSFPQIRCPRPTHGARRRRT